MWLWELSQVILLPSSLDFPAEQVFCELVCPVGEEVVLGIQPFSSHHIELFIGLLRELSLELFPLLPELIHLLELGFGHRAELGVPPDLYGVPVCGA